VAPDMIGPNEGSKGCHSNARRTAATWLACVGATNRGQRNACHCEIMKMPGTDQRWRG